jgi:hypothetical protein
MVEATLKNLRDRCMNMRAGAPSDAQEWLSRLLERLPR